jgi:hypothetical protein
VVAANPQLVEGDSPLVTLYVLSLSKAMKLSRSKDVASFEKAARLAVTLSTKLRISPQSTVDPVTSGRRKKDAAPPSYYDRMDDDDGNSSSDN